VTNLSGSQFLFRVWWIASIFTAEGTLFLSVLINKPSKKDYALFYKKFWYGFTPLYLFVLIICFLRFPSTTRTINVIPGSGTFLMLKAFINNVNVSFEAPLIFFGNLLIFVPLPFILSAFFKKLKPYQIILIGIIFPILVESYQYIFRCGDVDVDDLILNWIGFFIGLAVQIKANIKYSN
jgi:glycopeptide antibiotics resistance protein